ncbi:MAG TPA: hypothetical protein VL128_07720 [Candidatus Eisenbacteria bacterium]|nr:hypothetical protein [Candidatus Eisenbacteria bacterium]
MSGNRQDALAFPRCRYSFADGRRCAQPAHHQFAGLCFTHAHAAARPIRPSDFSRELAAAPDGVTSPEKVTRLLAKVALARIQGRITRREAGILTNLGNLLIQTARLAREAAASANPERPGNFRPSILDEDEFDDIYDDDDLTLHPPLD